MDERKAKPKSTRATAASKPPRAPKAKPPAAPADGTASQLIDQRIRDLGGWRGETLARMRALILAAVPDVVEEVKWRGTPVWSHGGIICTGEAYAAVVKLTFAYGATVPDPAGLFNASLAGTARRAIDIRQGEQVDTAAFTALVRAAVARNASPAPKRAGAVRLLSGGNPQIAKAEGDAPVRAYIAAVTDWRGDVLRRLDAVIERAVPGVRKAVKWNSPMYGTPGGDGYFLGVHVFKRYVKVAFFAGTSLRPVPPEPSKSDNTRYVHLREGDELDESQLAAWVTQAVSLPGWTPGRPL